jgi:hypothetical protein
MADREKDEDKKSTKDLWVGIVIMSIAIIVYLVVYFSTDLTDMSAAIYISAMGAALSVGLASVVCWLKNYDWKGLLSHKKEVHRAD